MTPDQIFVSGIVVQVIAALLAALAAVLAYLKGKDNEKKLDELHHEVNSRLSQLIEKTELAAHARGKEVGKREEKSDEAARVAQAGESSGE